MTIGQSSRGQQLNVTKRCSNNSLDANEFSPSARKHVATWPFVRRLNPSTQALNVIRISDGEQKVDHGCIKHACTRLLCYMLRCFIVLNDNFFRFFVWSSDGEDQHWGSNYYYDFAFVWRWRSDGAWGIMQRLKSDSMQMETAIEKLFFFHFPSSFDCEDYDCYYCNLKEWFFHRHLCCYFCSPPGKV